MISINKNASISDLLHLVAACAWGSALSSAAEAAPCSALLNRSELRLQDEKPQDLCQYAGQVVVVVNTASFCGYTPQYKALESLYERYRSRGLVVLGFPSNDFSQEPGTNKEVADFCENTFNVKFPMFAKSRVSASAGAALNPLFAELSRRTGAAPQWNFHKYLIARDGTAILSRASDVDPASRGFVQDIEKLLDAPTSPK
jgi:glutathione peroxidase